MTPQAIWRAGLARCAAPSVVWLLLAVLLAAATLVAFRDLHQLEPVATAWPSDPGFAAVADGQAPMRGQAGEVDGWQVEGSRAGIAVEAGTLRLRNGDPEGGVGVRQLWHLAPGGPRTFRLSADVASEAIKGTRKGFRVGEITLVADRDIERPYFSNMHRLSARNGTQPAARSSPPSVSGTRRNGWSSPSACATPPASCTSPT